MVELWQADPEGRVAQETGSLRRDGSTFTGWGRAATDAGGAWSFTTLVPGPSAPGRAAYVGLTVFARGLMNRLFTRAYLPVDDDALASDPLLAALGDRRDTLIAEADDSGFAFDIRLQGDRETVFLTYPRH
jgi:protocatechuate 3,4-dioxygenase alpha subunit